MATSTTEDTQTRRRFLYVWPTKALYGNYTVEIPLNSIHTDTIVSVVCWMH